MRRFSLFLLILFAVPLLAQENSRTILYDVSENGKPLPSRTISVKCSALGAAIVNPAAPESFYIDYSKRVAIKTNQFNDQKFAVVTSFDSLLKPVFKKETDTILGFICSKAIYNSFSNMVEVWYTQQSQVKGSPSISFIPDNGLVLKLVINDNRTIIARNMVPTAEAIVMPTGDFLPIPESRYLALQIQSRFTTIPVFREQQINYELDIRNPGVNSTDSTFRYAKGNIILKKVKLPKNSSKGSFFVQLTERSNGDAYDRVGSVFTFREADSLTIMDAMQRGVNVLPITTDNLGEKYQGIVLGPNYSPVVELMRFFTPFGVGHFNNKRIIEGYNWSEAVSYKQEVTALIPSGVDEMWIGVYIGNYDKGGHKVSLELNFYPDREAQETKKWIQPLFNTVNILEADLQAYGRIFLNDTLEVNFEVPDSIDHLQLLFTTTGHGGWGQGDEFVPKRNELFLDGKPIFQHTPWRTDCGAYRLCNPSSGNFPDGLSSSDLSRSNWCPGTSTPPFLIPLRNLSKGKHQLKLAIDQGPNEGTSFSHWSVSVVLVGNKK